MRNTDSIALAVIDTQSQQSWLLEPGQKVPMQRGLYRIVAGADLLDFDPSDSVMASSLTWVVARDGLRSSEALRACGTEMAVPGIRGSARNGRGGGARIAER